MGVPEEAITLRLCYLTVPEEAGVLRLRRLSVPKQAACLLLRLCRWCRAKQPTRLPSLRLALRCRTATTTKQTSRLRWW